MDITAYKKVDRLLSSYNVIKSEIAIIGIEIEELKSKCVGIGSIDYQFKGGPTNKVSSTVENQVVSWDSLEPKIKQLEDEKAAKERLIRKIDIALSTITDRDRKIIELRYFSKMCWDDVSDNIGQATVTCKIARSKSIKDISNILYN